MPSSSIVSSTASPRSVSIIWSITGDLLDRLEPAAARTRPRRARRTRLSRPGEGHHHSRQPRSGVERRPPPRAARPPSPRAAILGPAAPPSLAPPALLPSDCRPQRGARHHAAVPQGAWRRHHARRRRQRPISVGAAHLQRRRRSRCSMPAERSRRATLGWLAAQKSERLVVLMHHYPLDAGAFSWRYDRWRRDGSSRWLSRLGRLSVTVPMDVEESNREPVLGRRSNSLRRLPCSAATCTVRAWTTAAAWRLRSTGKAVRNGPAAPSPSTASRDDLSPPSGGNCREISSPRDQNRYESPAATSGCARRPSSLSRPFSRALRPASTRRPNRCLPVPNQYFSPAVAWYSTPVSTS